jgi:hypothetical protein
MLVKRPMVAFLSQLLLAIRSRFTSRARREAENLLLRQQLVVPAENSLPTKNWNKGGSQGATSCDEPTLAAGCNIKQLSGDPDPNAINTRIHRRCGAGLRGTNGPSSSWLPSGREALVAMVQPADLRYGDDSPARRWLDGTRVRTVLIE